MSAPPHLQFVGQHLFFSRCEVDIHSIFSSSPPRTKKLHDFPENHLTRSRSGPVKPAESVDLRELCSLPACRYRLGCEDCRQYPPITRIAKMIMLTVPASHNGLTRTIISVAYGDSCSWRLWKWRGEDGTYIRTTLNQGLRNLARSHQISDSGVKSYTSL